MTGFAPGPYLYFDAGPPAAGAAVIAGREDDLPLIGARPRPGILLAQSAFMSDDKGATEEEVQKIDVIRGSEVLGYEGAGREEHSGENAPRAQGDLRADLADNTKKDIEGR